MEERKLKRNIFFVLGLVTVGGILALILYKTNPEIFQLGNGTDHPGTNSPSDTLDFYDQQIDSAQDIQVQSKVRNIQTGLEQYFSMMGEYPSSLQALVTEGILYQSDLQGVNASFSSSSSDDYTLTVTYPSGDTYTLTPSY